MAFTFRAAITVIASGASPRTITKPTGVVEGDVLILQVSSAGADVTPTPPSGFVEVVAARNTTVPTIRVYTKMAGASEPADYSVTFPSGSLHSCSLMAWTPGAGNIVEADDADIQVNGSVDRICPSVDTTVADTLLCCFAALGNTGSAPHAGMTERWDDGSNPRIYSMTEIRAATGATGTRTATGVDTPNNTATVAFRESVAPPPGEPTHATYYQRMRNQ